MRVLTPLLLVLLASCNPSGGTLNAPHTGVAGQFTQQMVISNDPHHVLMGHLISVTQNGSHIHALVIGQRRDGVHRLRMHEAWSEGIQLPFTSTTRHLDGCTHGHCRDNAVGMVFLNGALIEHARTHGFSARLTGRSEAVTIHVPPTLFHAFPN